MMGNLALSVAHSFFTKLLIGLLTLKPDLKSDDMSEEGTLTH